VSPPAAVYLRLTSNVLQAIVADNANNIKLVLGETMVSCPSIYRQDGFFLLHLDHNDSPTNHSEADPPGWPRSGFRLPRLVIWSSGSIQRSLYARRTDIPSFVPSFLAIRKRTRFEQRACEVSTRKESSNDRISVILVHKRPCLACVGPASGWYGG
jgi:hypothetical protein